MLDVMSSTTIFSKGAVGGRAEALRQNQASSREALLVHNFRKLKLLWTQNGLGRSCFAPNSVGGSPYVSGSRLVHHVYW